MVASHSDAMNVAWREVNRENSSNHYCISVTIDRRRPYCGRILSGACHFLNGRLSQRSDVQNTMEHIIHLHSLLCLQEVRSRRGWFDCYRFYLRLLHANIKSTCKIIAYELQQLQRWHVTVEESWNLKENYCAMLCIVTKRKKSML